LSDAEWQAIAGRLEAVCKPLGFDLLEPFGVSYAAEGLEGFGRRNSLGILIGNTRHLWPIFTRARELDPTLATAEHPLDRYVTTTLTRAVPLATAHAARFVFSHVTSPQAFPIARLAERLGVAAISPSHLAIHPLHGPWIALRAVVTIDVEGPDAPPPEPAGPCLTCSAPCMPALERAINVSGTPVTSAAVAAHAAEWIAVRDACPIGKASRYSDAQVRYHYAPRQGS
jgi:methylmalonic aciduria homocystinuria type C protein